MTHSSKLYDETNFPNWTIEEFDAIESEHDFSRRFKRAEKAAIRKYRRQPVRRFSFRAATAAAALCVALPVGVYAAITHADFFRNAFGDSGRQSVAAHEEYIDDGKGGQVAVTYPEREYIAVDEEAAETLLGKKISDSPVSVEVNDHTLTVLSAVRDRNAMTMEFTVSCDSGVSLYDIDPMDNEAKGPAMSQDATFFFMVENAGENIYVDLDKSTDTMLHCYDYCVFMEPLEDGEAPVLNLYYADKPVISLEEDDDLEEKQIIIPATSAVDSHAFISESGGYLELSPLSCSIDLGKGLGLSAEEAYDPWSMESLTINYEDGTVYQVYDRDNNIDNTSYACGGLGETDSIITLNLNRLVDPDQVASITINGISYTCNQ